MTHLQKFVKKTYSIKYDKITGKYNTTLTYTRVRNDTTDDTLTADQTQMTSGGNSNEKEN